MVCAIAVKLLLFLIAQGRLGFAGYAERMLDETSELALIIKLLPTPQRKMVHPIGLIDRPSPGCHPKGCGLPSLHNVAPFEVHN